MKFFYFLLAILLNVAVLSAQTTINSAGNGNWSDPLSWDQQRLPTSNDVIVITAGDMITLDQNISVSDITLRVLGTFKMGSQKKLELNAGSIINILSGGAIVSEDQNNLSFISLGDIVKYRGNKVFQQGWESGTVKGMAYATTTSGDLDQSGQGFIFGKLPAVWQDFNLVRTPEDYIQMVWVTSHETGVRVFDIERSYNANSWETIGSLQSVGNLSSPQNIYSFVDNKPGTGMIYYRVKHRYPDGKIIFSAVRLIKIDKHSSAFNVYPNPASSEVKVALANTSVEGTNLRIFNTSGQSVKNLNVPKGIQLFPVDLTGLSSGMYLLQMSTPGGEKQFMRLVKH